MQSDNVILFKTHKINDAVIAELKKIKKSNYDYYLLCDNSKNFFHLDLTLIFQKLFLRVKLLNPLLWGKIVSTVQNYP